MKVFVDDKEVSAHETFGAALRASQRGIIATHQQHVIQDDDGVIVAKMMPSGSLLLKAQFIETYVQV